jgi:hypothetical protein
MTVNRFGDREVLLDRLVQIVLPAFTDDSLIRRRGSESVAEYFFYNVEIMTLESIDGNKVVGIYGDFIKNVDLVRTQIFDQEQGLLHDPQRMPSSPSSTFLLILNNHQLVFLPRTPHAPGMKEFETTVRDFAGKKYKAYIDQAHDALRQTGTPVTKKELRANLPSPTINVVPQSNLESVSDFIRRFDKLKSIDFRLLQPNPTIDAAEIFNECRGVLENLGARSGKLTAVNNADGLDKEAAVKVVSDAARGGNQDILLKGDDEAGAFLSGSNEDFKVSVPLDALPKSSRGIANKLYETFKAFLPFVASKTKVENSSQQHQLNNLDNLQ